MLAGCGLRANNVCAFDKFLPEYLFFECPAVGDYAQYLLEQQVKLCKHLGIKF